MAKKLLVICVGYLIAVVVAVIITEVIYLTPSAIPDNGKWGSLFKNVNDIGGIFAIGLAYTFVTALPGFVITLIIAKRRQWHDTRYYIMSGVATSLLAHGILAAFFDGKLLQGYLIVLASMPGGAAGGYAFCRWRRKILSA